jgi:3',5'-cyclic AMP phosphodiesterase CpdA
MTVQAAFVVLSDLHFGRDLVDAAELPPLNLSRLVKWIGKEEEVAQFFEQKCLGHSTPCVKKLPRYLNYLLQEMRDEGFERSCFDLFILLGDQATIADAQSYKFLRGYLSQPEYESRGADGGTYCAGLNIANPDQIIAIPGNHDKLLRADLSLYNSEFTKKIKLTDTIEKRGSAIAVRSIGGRDFVFILVDASN